MTYIDFTDLFNKDISPSSNTEEVKIDSQVFTRYNNSIIK